MKKRKIEDFSQIKSWKITDERKKVVNFIDVQMDEGDLPISYDNIDGLFATFNSEGSYANVDFGDGTKVLFVNDDGSITAVVMRDGREVAHETINGTTVGNFKELLKTTPQLFGYLDDSIMSSIESPSSTNPFAKGGASSENPSDVETPVTKPVGEEDEEEEIESSRINSYFNDDPDLYLPNIYYGRRIGRIHNIGILALGDIAINTSLDEAGIYEYDMDGYKIGIEDTEEEGEKRFRVYQIGKNDKEEFFPDKNSAIKRMKRWIMADGVTSSRFYITSAENIEDVINRGAKPVNYTTELAIRWAKDDAEREGLKEGSDEYKQFLIERAKKNIKDYANSSRRPNLRNQDEGNLEEIEVSDMEVDDLGESSDSTAISVAGNIDYDLAEVYVTLYLDEGNAYLSVSFFKQMEDTDAYVQVGSADTKDLPIDTVRSILPVQEVTEFQLIYTKDQAEGLLSELKEYLSSVNIIAVDKINTEIEEEAEEVEIEDESDELAVASFKYKGRRFILRSHKVASSRKGGKSVLFMKKGEFYYSTEGHKITAAAMVKHGSPEFVVVSTNAPYYFKQKSELKLHPFLLVKDSYDKWVKSGLVKNAGSEKIYKYKAGGIYYASYTGDADLRPKVRVNKRKNGFLHYEFLGNNDMGWAKIKTYDGYGGEYFKVGMATVRAKHEIESSRKPNLKNLRNDFEESLDEFEQFNKVGINVGDEVNILDEFGEDGNPLVSTVKPNYPGYDEMEDLSFTYAQKLQAATDLYNKLVSETKALLLKNRRLMSLLPGTAYEKISSNFETSKIKIPSGDILKMSLGQIEKQVIVLSTMLNKIKQESEFLNSVSGGK